MITLENDQLIVEIAKAGAEVYSIKNKETEIEYMWSGDKAFWGRHSPILFPIVGKLMNNEYLVDGKVFSMTQHGFARDMVFTCVERTEHKAVFCLTSDEETMAKYPFHFELYVVYILDGETLHVNWQVSNPDGEQTLPFSIGAHPAFSTALMPGDTFEDYYFDLPEVVGLQSRELAPSGELTHNYFSLGKCKEVPLHYDLFNKDALVFEDLHFESIALRCRNHGHGVTMTFPEFPYLGLWSPRTNDMRAPFVCIEPWFGHADTVDGPFELVEKPGILHLAPLKEFNTRYSMIFY